MKKRILVFAVLLVLSLLLFNWVFFGLFEHKKSDRQAYLDQIRGNGSGNVVTEKRDVSGLNYIVFSDEVFQTNMIVDQGDMDSITIEAEDNVIPQIKTIYEANGVPSPFFSITYGDMPRPTKPINIHITTKKLDELVFIGEGNLTINNVNNNNLNLRLSRINKTTLNNVKTNNLTVSLMMNTKMFATGQTDTQNVSVATGSSYQADGFTSRVAKVLVSGNSKATVDVSDFLSAEIKDFGEILYKGNPQVNQSTILGKISKIP